MTAKARRLTATIAVLTLIVCGWSGFVAYVDQLSRSAQAAPPQFQFQIPAGWTDVTHDASWRDIASALSKPFAKDAELLVLASEAKDVSSSAPLFLAVRVKQPLDLEETLSRAKTGAAGAAFSSSSAERVQIDGAPAVRVIGTPLSIGAPLTFLVYYVQGGLGGAAILIYMAGSEEFPRYQSLFEASAQAMEGAAALPWYVQAKLEVSRYEGLIVLILCLLGLALQMLKQDRDLEGMLTPEQQAELDAFQKQDAGLGGLSQSIRSPRRP